MFLYHFLVFYLCHGGILHRFCTNKADLLLDYRAVERYCGSRGVASTMTLMRTVEMKSPPACR